MRILTLFCVLLASLLPSQETVHLEARDGQPLTGTFRAAAGEVRGGILLLHMYRSSRIAYASFLPRLAEAGFHVLALDMRGHGDSALDAEGKRIDISRAATRDPAANPFLKMHLDALAGLAFLKEKGSPADRLAIVGASVGCSVAIHTAVLHGEDVAAIVLMTPGTNYLGVPSIRHAPELTGRPVLILSSEEEAGRGARPLAEAMKKAAVTLKILPQTNIHGTRMFGRVPGIGAEIIDWLQKVLTPRAEMALPFDKRVLLDGELDPSEAPAAHWEEIAVSKGRKARLRLCHDEKLLFIAFDINERCMRRNGVQVGINPGASGPALPDETCFKIVFAPRMGTEARPRVFQGEAGKWKEIDAKGVIAETAFGGRVSWSCELALRLDVFFADHEKEPLRIALQVDGATENEHHSLPAGKDVLDAPRRWLKARLSKPSK